MRIVNGYILHSLRKIFAPKDNHEDIRGSIQKYAALITIIFFLPSVFYRTGFFSKQVFNDATDISFVVSKGECCKGFYVEPTNYSFGDFG